jgi:hypothetical protein
MGLAMTAIWISHACFALAGVLAGIPLGRWKLKRQLRPGTYFRVANPKRIP